jgi:MFS family permease
MTTLAIALRTRTFRSLRRHRNYRIFFTGQLVSLAGTWMQNVALAWLVLELSGSPLAVGALAFWRFVPFTIFGLVAGVVADRIESRKLVMATQAAAMAVSIALAVVTLTGTATLPIVYVLAGLGGIALAFDAPGRQSLTFQMVGPRELPNAVALNTGLFNGSRVIGPAIAGLIIAAVGTGLCFVLNAFSFLAVLAALAVVRGHELYPVERDPSAKVVAGLRRAFSFAWNDPQLRLILSVVTVVATVGFNFHVLVPLLAADTLDVGPEGFGLLSASFGLGALVGALTTATFRRASWRLFSTARGSAFALLLAPFRTPCSRASPLRHRDLVHALHCERERTRAARRPRLPARPLDRPLPLRVPRPRTRRGALRRMAGDHGWDDARLRVRGGDRAHGDRPGEREPRAGSRARGVRHPVAHRRPALALCV